MYSLDTVKTTTVQLQLQVLQLQLEKQGTGVSVGIKHTILTTGHRCEYYFIRNYQKKEQ